MELLERGFGILRGVFAPNEVADATAAMEQLLSHGPSDAVRSSRGVAYAVRDVIQPWPGALDLLRKPVTKQLVYALVGTRASVVRSMFLDKHPLRPWALPWHRDVVFPLRTAARWRVPQDTLERMVAVRVHLDDADEANGTLLVVPGSHAGTDLPPSPPVAPDPTAAVALRVKAGDVVLMSPLLLHRSSRATVSGRRRRVLHFDVVAEGALPAPLSWRDSWPV